MPENLESFCERFQPVFCTRTRDGSAHARTYLRGQLIMEEERNYANIERTFEQGDGQNLQQFMSDSPWSAEAVFRQIRLDIAGHEALQSGGLIVLDESADEKAGTQSVGAACQHNGREGKVEVCQVGVGLVFAHPATKLWALVEGELFLPESWFGPEAEALRQKLGVPTERTFQTKPELGLEMIRRVAREQLLAFELVVADELYGRKSSLRQALAEELHLRYAVEVPADLLVFMHRPKAARVRERYAGAVPVRSVAQKRTAVWKHQVVRSCERGLLEAQFLLKRVWTRTNDGGSRAEWLVVRRDKDGRLAYYLSNASAQAAASEIIRDCCQRYVVERAFEDCKSELGWADLRARKYRAWEHHLALTAAALWFVEEIKLQWQQRYKRDPQLLKQLHLQVLPALSTANVRQMLAAVLPLPKLSPEQAQQAVTKHLLNRARSTLSRLKARQAAIDSS